MARAFKCDCCGEYFIPGKEEVYEHVSERGGKK